MSDERLTTPIQQSIIDPAEYSPQQRQLRRGDNDEKEKKTRGACFQSGDGESDITAEEQWDITEKAIREFMDSLSL